MQKTGDLGAKYNSIITCFSLTLATCIIWKSLQPNWGQGLMEEEEGIKKITGEKTKTNNKKVCRAWSIHPCVLKMWCWEEREHSFRWQREYTGRSRAGLLLTEYWLSVHHVTSAWPVAAWAWSCKNCWPELITHRPCGTTSLKVGGTWGQTPMERELPPRR